MEVLDKRKIVFSKEGFENDELLSIYKKILKPGGIVHMKTDSDILFEYTLEQIEENKYDCLESTWDLYANLPEDLDPDTREIFHIQTYYEKLFSSRGHKIKYCKFKIS